MVKNNTQSSEIISLGKAKDKIHLLEGKMKLQVGNLEYSMKQDESFYFNALEKYGIMPISDTVKYINIFV